MRLREKRILRFLELKMSHGSGAQHTQPWDLKAILLEIIGQDFYNRAPREGANSIVRIKHGKVFSHAGEEFVGLLLIHADARSIEASYADLQTGGARSIPMQDGEGVRTEAHVVIRLSHTTYGTTQSYPVALEESPGLSPSVLLSRLQRPVHKAGQRSKKSSAGEIVSWYPVIELDGLFSKSLLDEIESGNLNSFDLVRQSVESGGMDEPGELVRQQQVLRVGVRPGPEDRIKLMGKALKRRRFLAYLFGYLALLSLFLFVALLFRPMIHGLLAQVDFVGLQRGMRLAFVFIYQFVFWQMVFITLLGLYYLTDRIHRSNTDGE